MIKKSSRKLPYNHYGVNYYGINAILYFVSDKEERNDGGSIFRHVVETQESLCLTYNDLKF